MIQPKIAWKKPGTSLVAGLKDVHTCYVQAVFILKPPDFSWFNHVQPSIFRWLKQHFFSPKHPISLTFQQAQGMRHVAQVLREEYLILVQVLSMFLGISWSIKLTVFFGFNSIKLYKEIPVLRNPLIPVFEFIVCVIYSIKPAITAWIGWNFRWILMWFASTERWLGVWHT